MIKKIFEHHREGTLSKAIKFKLNKWLDKRIEKEDMKNLSSRKLHRFNIRNEEEAFEFLFREASRISRSAKPHSKVVVIGDQKNKKVLETIRKFTDSGIQVITGSYENFQEGIFLKDAYGSSSIVSFYFNEKINHSICDILLKDENLKNIRFEYLGDTREDFAFARIQDHQRSFDFVSPLLISESNYFNLYKDSLIQFEKKCDIRDFMDLCQLVRSVVDRNVPGDIAEFGSYKGHSGFLISRLLETFKSDKKLFMFDTFEKFPSEDIGVDSFWSDTHEVNFDEVCSKFINSKNVSLIKGDFTKTFDSSGINNLSMIYIDCDSYRATTYLMEKLFDKVLSPGGLMILEDYGHPALLGNRLAFHHFMDKRKNHFRYFSQFSGFQIVIK